MSNKSDKKDLVVLAKLAIELTASLLCRRKSYNLITESSFDAYILYLNKMADFVSTLSPYDFDNLIAQLHDWNISKPNSISNSIKNTVISNIFVLKTIEK